MIICVPTLEVHLVKIIKSADENSNVIALPRSSSLESFLMCENQSGLCVREESLSSLLHVLMGGCF